MSDTKSNVAMYNDFLKSINDVKRKVRTAQNIKRKALKKDIKASEEDVKVIEDNALTNEEIDFKCNEVKIYCFSNGDKYIGKIKDAKMDGIGIYSFFTEDEIEFGGKIIMTNGAKLNVSKPNRKRIRKLLQGLIV